MICSECGNNSINSDQLACSCGTPIDTDNFIDPTVVIESRVIVAKIDQDFSENQSIPVISPLTSNKPEVTTLFCENLCEKVIAKCKLEKILGKGGMGVVYKARHLSLDIPVAVKIMLPEYLTENDFVQRFYREAQVAAKINHQNVVRVYDCGSEENILYIVMDYVDGGDISEILQKEGKLNLKKSLNVAVSICTALVEAEKYNIIHRDIKPENIMVTGDGVYKLADLGLAKEVDTLSAEETTLTMGNIGMGSPSYMPPEQATDAQSCDQRCDIYALGCTLFHLLCGSPPYRGSNWQEVICKHATEIIPHATSVNKSIPVTLSQIIEKCMAKKPADRYQSASGLLAALNTIPRQGIACSNGIVKTQINGQDLVQTNNSDHAATKVKQGATAGKEVFKRDQEHKDGVAPRSFLNRMTVLLLTTGLLAVTIVALNYFNKNEPISSVPQAIPITASTQPLVQLQHEKSIQTIFGVEVDIPEEYYSSLEGLALGSDVAQKQQKEFTGLSRLPLEAITKKSGIAFRLVPPGTFSMGSPESEIGRQYNEKLHKVKLTNALYIAKYEITQKQWSRVMGSTASEFTGDNLPVETVSWDECQKFLTKLCKIENVPANTLRLLTEAEWEYAAKAGTSTPFYFGYNLHSDMANFDGSDPYGDAKKWIYREKTVPVGLFQPNAWGLYDMCGNVWEWCQDWDGMYPFSQVTNPNGSSQGTHRVLRGGAWGSYSKHCRAANRGKEDPKARNINLGFRICMPVVQSK